MRTHKVVPARNIIDMISVAKVIEFTTSLLILQIQVATIVPEHLQFFVIYK